MATGLTTSLHTTAMAIEGRTTTLHHITIEVVVLARTNLRHTTPTFTAMPPRITTVATTTAPPTLAPAVINIKTTTQITKP